MENQGNDTEKEEFVDKSVHQVHNDSKPVGYGSSIQNSGHGNKTRPQNNDDVNPTSQQDHIQKIKDGETDEAIPNTDGTGANRAVPRDESLIIKKDTE